MRVSGIPYVQGTNSYADIDGAKYAIAIHNTSNDAGAAAEAAYATRRTDRVSAHFYVDNRAVIQSLDTTARAGHAGNGPGNNHSIAVEIRGFNAWSRQTWLDGVCWDLLGRVLAEVCRAYGIEVRRASVAEMQANPKVRAFYSHDDMRQAWGGTDHTDPGPNFPWDKLFAVVNAALNPHSAQEDEDMGGFANLKINVDGPTSIAVPGGAVGWRPTWLAVCNETHGHAYALRIWTTTGDGNWTPIDADGLVKLESGKVVSWELPEDTRCVSITRMAFDEMGKIVDRLADGEVGTPRSSYDDDLSVALER